jgi:hypothetical protein
VNVSRYQVVFGLIAAVTYGAAGVAVGVWNADALDAFSAASVANLLCYFGDSYRRAMAQSRKRSK